MHKHPVFYFSGLLGTVGALNALIIPSLRGGSGSVTSSGGAAWTSTTASAALYERPDGFGFRPMRPGADDDDDE